MFAALVLTALFLAGCAGADFIRTLEGPVGLAHRPVLEEVFVTPRSGRGETVRIYVRASDPDGDLDRILVSLEQRSLHHIQEIVSLPGKARAISGYIDFSGTVPPPSQPIGELEVWIHVQAEDRAGNRSEDRKLFLIISDGRVKQTPPPDGRFEVTRRLGWLGRQLRTPEGLVGNGRE